MALPPGFEFRRISPVTIAVILSVLLAVWLLIGNKNSALDEAPAPQSTQEAGLHHVETRWSEAHLQPSVLVVQGQLLPWQQVGVQAQVTGRVGRLFKQQGDQVEEGEPLLQLSDEGRAAALAQAQANLRLRETDLNSARALNASQFVPEAELIRLESELAGAQAELESAQLAEQYSRPRALFRGIVDRRHVEPGELVQPGTALMDLVDVERLKVTAQIPQQEVGRLAKGQVVELKLLDGRRLQGEVQFISHSADPATRSFYLEVRADNPELWRVAGASVTLEIQLAPVRAHRLSPALLSLNADGQLGIHTVDEQNRVEFYPVRVLGVDSQGATMAGLPDRVRVITLGGGFVRPGQQVRASGAAE